MIPDNAKNTTLKLDYVKFFGGTDSLFDDSLPCVTVGKKAENTKIELYWTEFQYEIASRIENNGKNTKTFEWYVKRTWEPEVRGNEYWGT